MAATYLAPGQTIVQVTWSETVEKRADVVVDSSTDLSYMGDWDSILADVTPADYIDYAVRERHVTQVSVPR